MILKEKNIDFIICTTCTLNCKLCINCVPLSKEKGIRYFAPFETLEKEIKGVFEIYDHIETASAVGGEPLLHEQLPEFTALALRKYSSKFDRFRIITNGTVLPSEALLRVIHDNAKGNCDFQISDYGPLSNKLQDVVKILEENKIPYRVKKYYGEDQYCGGWIDFGPLDQPRGYSDEEARKLMESCRCVIWETRCPGILDGKLCLCNRANFGHFFNFFESGQDEYVNLLDEAQPLEEKKEIVAGFGKKLIRACYYCNGFDVKHAKRFSGAEQV